MGAVVRILGAAAAFVGIVSLFKVDILAKVVPPSTAKALAETWGRVADGLAIFLILCLLYVILRAVRLRDKPLTILRTVVTIEIMPESARKYRVSRRQIIRANKTGVSAVFSRMFPTPKARVQKPTASARAPHGVTNEFEAQGSETHGWEGIHRFDPELPFPFYSPFIPDWWFKSDFERLGWFAKHCVVERTSSTEYDETDCDVNPHHGFLADLYEQKNLDFTLIIPKPDQGTIDPARVSSDVVGWEFTRQAVIDHRPLPTPRNGGYELNVFLRRLYNSEFRFQWSGDLF